MIRKLLPLIIILIGAAAGVGAGMVLRPAPEHAGEAAEPGQGAPAVHGKSEVHGEHGDPEGLPEYVKLSNQFIIPVIEKGEITSMIVLSLSLEAEPGSTDKIYASEPKLRDVMLQVLFEHSNAGGFRGSFTDGANLVLLREALREVAVKTMPDEIRDVLITEIVRQDT